MSDEARVDMCTKAPAFKPLPSALITELATGLSAKPACRPSMKKIVEVPPLSSPSLLTCVAGS